MSESPLPLRKQAHPHALAAREAKRLEAGKIGIDAAYIAAFVETFYARIREDALLGPIFAERIANWDHHLGRMKAFWGGVLLGSGEYTGNPMQKHFAIPGLGADHFAHWLTLFYAVLDDLEPHPEASIIVAGRARMIADSLLTGITLQRDGLIGGKAGAGLPHHGG